MTTDIKTELKYAEDDGTRPYAFARKMTEEEDKKYPKGAYGGTIASVDVVVRDGRSHQLSLAANSFELIEQKTSLSTQDFYDNVEKIVGVYYAEMAETIKKATGAAYVHVFHHQVRNEKKSNGDVQNLNTSIQGYANGIHSDTHPKAAEDLFKQLASSNDDLSKFRKGRFLYINAWRNISETPISNNHLGMCDESSLVKPDDYLTADLFAQGYDVVQYRLNARNSAQHRWYYFSSMKKDEVILFKQWDSDRSLAGRVCFHTAFNDPNAPKDAPVRESIEVRAMCYFPDHEPNTCPHLEEINQQEEDGTVDEKKAMEHMNKLMAAIRALDSWPASGVHWLKTEAAKSSGLKGALKIIVDDQGNYHGLRSCSKSHKKKVLELLLNAGALKLLETGMAKKEETKNAKKSDSSPLMSVGLPLAAGCAIGWTLGYMFHKNKGAQKLKKIFSG